jgi:murein DD-endopeptidase MepM/ murein hydrolase activator NlpD
MPLKLFNLSYPWIFIFMYRKFIGSAHLNTPIYKHPHKLCALLFAIFLSGCTIEGPERLVYLKSGEVVVLRGDTLSSVAARHGVSVKDLAECNGLKAPYRLTKIAKLQLPGGRTHFSPEPESVSNGPVILKDNEDVQWTDVGDSPADRSSKGPKPVLMADIDADSDLENSLTETDEGSDEDSDSNQSKSRDGWNVTDHSKKGAERSDDRQKTREKTGKKETTKSVKKEAPKPVGFCRPVSGKITQKFQKNKKGAQIPGIRFKAPKGTPVYASSDGIVLLSGKLEGDPSKVVILINHPNNWSSCYKAIDKACVSKEQEVKQGDLIGYSSGPTCIFELRNARGPVDPEKKFND